MHSADRHPHRLEADKKISRELRRTKLMPYIAFAGMSAAMIAAANTDLDESSIAQASALTATVAASGALYGEHRYTEKRIDKIVDSYRGSLGIWSEPEMQTILREDEAGNLRQTPKIDRVAVGLHKFRSEASSSIAMLTATSAVGLVGSSLIDSKMPASVETMGYSMVGGFAVSAGLIIRTRHHSANALEKSAHAKLDNIDSGFSFDLGNTPMPRRDSEA